MAPTSIVELGKKIPACNITKKTSQCIYVKVISYAARFVYYIAELYKRSVTSVGLEITFFLPTAGTRSGVTNSGSVGPECSVFSSVSPF